MPRFVTVAIIYLTLILRSPNRPQTEISFEKKTTAAALNYVKKFSIMNKCTLNHNEK